MRLDKKVKKIGPFKKLFLVFQSVHAHKVFEGWTGWMDGWTGKKRFSNGFFFWDLMVFPIHINVSAKTIPKFGF